MKYAFLKTSPTRWLITILFTIFIGMAFGIAMLINQLFTAVWQYLIFSVLFIILAFYVTRYTSVVKVETEINELGISIRYFGHFIMGKMNDIVIEWNDIRDYVFEKERQFDKFSITLNNNYRIKLYHNNDYDDKDDFLNFIDAFTMKAVEYNSRSTNHMIKKGKTFYEGKGGFCW